MKRFVFVALLALVSLCQGATLLQPYQINAANSENDNLPTTGTLHQALYWIDQNWNSSGSGANAYDSTIDTNMTSDSKWWIRIETNWLNGTNRTLVITHPNYVTMDGIMFPVFVTKEEFYATLNALGFANVDWFTHTDGTYGSSDTPPNNTSVQTYTIASQLVTGQVIGVHCWGGGASLGEQGYAAGGYSYGELTVVTSAEYLASTNASYVTNGMVLCVQVGNVSQRAAVWRQAGTYCASYSNEMIVAGGAGGVGSVVNGGFGGGTSGGTGADEHVGESWWGTEFGGTGGSQSAGGTGGTATTGASGVGSVFTGANGVRIWGGAAGGGYSGRGGDGYFGGGGGGGRSFFVGDNLFQGSAGGGGGSGYVHPQLSAGSTTNTMTSYPANNQSIAYGLNAGTPGNAGRVAFVVLFKL
jgi:hypothetical protein